MVAASRAGGQLPSEECGRAALLPAPALDQHLRLMYVNRFRSTQLGIVSGGQARDNVIGARDTYRTEFFVD